MYDVMYVIQDSEHEVMRFQDKESVVEWMKGKFSEDLVQKVENWDDQFPGRGMAETCWDVLNELTIVSMLKMENGQT